MMTSGYNIGEIVQEAQTRWLKPAEVLFILQNYENHYQITNEPPQKPPSGSLFLFNKRVLRFFRKDGHNWRRKKDGRTVGEAHERLKVGNVEALNCYYAHGEQNPDFQRRCYWILDPAYDHIVLVHYRDISLGRSNAGSVSTVSPTSSSIFIQSPNSCTTQLPQSAVVGSENFEPYEYSSTPNSTEVSSDMLTKGDGTSHMGMMAGAEETDSSPNLEIDQALKRLEEQLSLDDENLNDIGPLYMENGYYSNEPEYMVNKQNYSEYGEIDAPNTYISQVCSGENGEQHQQQQFENEFSITGNDTSSWEFEVLGFNGGSAGSVPQQNSMYTSDINGVVHPSSSRDPPERQEKYLSSNVVANNDTPTMLNQEVDDLKFTPYSHASNMLGSDVDFYSTMFDQGQNGMPLQSDLILTTVQEQKFNIREISPEWGYAHEPTKVIIIGSFRCDPSNYAWSCMFGDIEVPLEIIQEGVFSCQAPPGLPGKVSLGITSSNRESCSEVREFEYRVNPRSLVNTSSSHTELRSSEELLLLVRCVQLLLSDPPKKKGECVIKPGVDPLGSLKPHEDSWDQVIEALLDGSWASFTTTDWLLQELLKDKLQQWLSSRLQEEEDLPALSKREQGIIHMVSGLGFGWALTPILEAGVNVDFRDVNGWTALHWAARFGREKMVAELLASGASAGAVTDPNPQDPVGKTPASIAATYGHKGLAGYLSELALTSHLSSLTIEESELSRSSADVEAQRTINSVSNTNLVINEDQLSMKDTLAAVRNAAQAAARIQSAFRAHSFRRRQEKEAAGYGSGDEYGILPSEIGELSAVSKLAFRSARDNNAALSIQKKYRGWKGRKDFLSLRQKVVKIQAHVRGYQVRKNYKVICWAVGVVEKVVLRWRRKGVGLRGFRQEADSVDTSEDEDVAKVFRKQKVDAALDEAVSRVLSMVESQEARQQYRRMLERYRQAKAERGGLGNSESGSASQSDIADMENDDLRWCA